MEEVLSVEVVRGEIQYVLFILSIYFVYCVIQQCYDDNHNNMIVRRGGK